MQLSTSPAPRRRLPRLSLHAGILAAVCAACCQPASAQEDFPRGQLSGDVVPQHYAMDLTIDPRQDGFTGEVAIDVAVAAPIQVIWLHGLGLVDVVASVESGGERINADYHEVDPLTGVARLDLEHEIAAGPATLRFVYSAGYRNGAEGLFLTEVGEDRYVFSQMQPIDARRVFPGFDDPRFKTPFDLAVTAPVGDVVVTNTPLKSSGEPREGLVTHHFGTTLPLPTDLLAFAVGPLDVVDAPPIPPNELRRHPLPLRGIATRGQGGRLGYALRNTADMVIRLERYFGLAFPYPKLDLIASPQMSGAMENAGAILYEDRLLLLADDAPPAQRRGYGITHAHELSHQWFGDLVTPAWWDDIWLNESFAEWMGYKVAAAWQPQLVAGIDLTGEAFGAMEVDSLSAGRPIHQPVTDNTQITATFDSITYQKGGGVLAMFESYLGEDVFRKGVQLHLGRHLNATATSGDFFRAMADASGQPAVIDAFRSFVDQPGVPLVTVDRSGDGRRLLLSQKRYRPIGSTLEDSQTWKIPFCVTLYGVAAPQKRCTLLADRSGELELPEGASAVMPNAGGAGYYRFSLDEEDLEPLMDIATTIPAGEALALADSVAAAFRAGQLPFDALLAAAGRLAEHPDRLVALRLSRELLEVQNRWADEAGRAAVAAALVDLYGPRLAALGFDPRAGVYENEDADRRLLRRSLVWMLAVDGRDPAIVAKLADAARRSLDEPAALDPEFREVAWIVGLWQSGPEFAAAMADLLRNSPDPFVRSAAATALGKADDRAMAKAALELSVGPGVGTNEMLTIAFWQLDGAATRNAAWPWLKEHFAEFTNKLPGFAQEFAYGLASGFCDGAHRQSVADFMAPAAAHSRSGSLQVARALERMDLCIAQKAVLGPQVTAALPGLPGG